MSKKFDVVIGNPPYQEEAQGEGTRATPLYHLFMDAAYEVGRKAVLITPARFLFNAGLTPKAWNAKMLADPHLSIAHYVPNSDDLFPGTDIKAGIVVTYRDGAVAGQPITTFTSRPELLGIVQATIAADAVSIQEIGITSSRSYRYTETMYVDHPLARELRPEGNHQLINTNTFEQFSFLLNAAEPADSAGFVRIHGLVENRRAVRWIRREYIIGPESFNTFKVALSAANGSGAFGETLSTPMVLGPDEAVTQTFVTFGCFPKQSEAEACRAYLQTKFARALLGVLKVTQHNPAKVWRHVPLQDFTANSDLDWSRSIPQIDQQLYTKYSLTAAQIDFIETNVKPMD